MEMTSRPSEGTLRARQQAFREAEILRTASELLCRHGCAAFTMDEVARRLGISKATLYAHFRSRTQLIDAALRDAAQRVLTEAEALGAEDLPGMLRLLVERSLQVGVEDSGPLPVPCCLREVECPYAGWAPLEETLKQAGGSLADGDGLTGGQVLRVLSAAVAGKLRAEGRQPTDADVDTVLRYLNLPR